jgi:hypothetical protein
MADQQWGIDGRVGVRRFIGALAKPVVVAKSA